MQMACCWPRAEVTEQAVADGPDLVFDGCVWGRWVAGGLNTRAAGKVISAANGTEPKKSEGV